MSSAASHRPIYLCKSHPDFHLPDDLIVGAGFDGEKYAGRLKEAGADAVVFFAKCHYGHAYYHTRVGYRHPGLQCDMLAEVVRGARKRGLGVIAYFSVFLDSVAVRANPDWALQATSAGSDAGFDSGNFLRLCVNSPYLEALFIPQAEEVVREYDVDELFFDTMTGFKPCYCASCQARFGKEIPAGSESPHWAEYVAWYRDCYDRFYAESARAVHEANPHVGVTFNWEWGIRRPTSPPPHITRLAADLIPTGTTASLVTRYLAGTDYPFEYMCGRFLHGLGDWNNTTAETVRYTAACTVANGGSFYIIDRQLPDGSLEERGYTMMQQVFRDFIQPRREVLEGTRHLPEVAVLHSHDHLMGDRLQFFPDADVRKKRMEPFEGVSRLFMHHARHYTAVSRETFLKQGHRYPVLVLPEVEYLDDDFCRELETYVGEGGKLLVTQSEAVAGVHPGLLRLAGVQHEGWAELDYAYFGEGAEPLLATGRFAQVKPTMDAEMVVPRIAPMRAGNGGAKFGHGKAPPGAPDGYAAVIRREFGEGEVIYLAMPAFGSYWLQQNPYLADLALDSLDRLWPEPLVRVKTRAQVELVLLRKERDLIVHLVNHSGRERLLGHWYPLTEYMPIIQGLEVEIRHGQAADQIRLVPSGETPAVRQCGHYLRVQVPELEYLQSLLLKEYFKD